MGEKVHNPPSNSSKHLQQPKRWRVLQQRRSFVRFTLLSAVVVYLTYGLPNSHRRSPCHDISPEECVQLMTLEEKVGQMASVSHNYLKDKKDIKTFNIGALLSGGGFGPKGEGGTPTQWANMRDTYQRIALTTRLAIPLLAAVDSVHGHSNVEGATVFPHHIGLGAANDSDLVRRVGDATRKELIATGIDWNYSPCVAVARDDRWARTFESFSEDTLTVQKLIVEEIKGLQGGDGGVVDQHGVVATAKHFFGDGGTTFGTGSKVDEYLLDQGDTQLDEETLRRIHLAPYIAAVGVNVGAVMVSYSSLHGEKMHTSKKWITDELKGKLGFQGIVTSDWEGLDYLYPHMSSKSTDYAKAITIGINAGIDMVMVPDRYQSFTKELQAEVLAGRIPMSRIDDAVTRIIRTKQKLNLFQYPYVNRTLLPSVGSKQHRAIAREAVAKSMVLLKNDNGNDGKPLLPLPKTGSKYSILMSGRGAHNLKNQCGGWTISWQGISGPSATGTTIFEGIKAAVKDTASIKVDYKSTIQEIEKTAEKADIGIAVVGETPYAEGMGDVASLDLNSTDAAVIKAVCSKSTRGCIVIVLSGRPLVIKDYLSLAPVWIAGWLPGSEGGGVADVLFGSMPFTGKLSYTWPKSTSQEPTNFDDGTASDPQFSIGHGLSL